VFIYKYKNVKPRNHPTLLLYTQRVYLHLKIFIFHFYINIHSYLNNSAHFEFIKKEFSRIHFWISFHDIRRSFRMERVRNLLVQSHVSRSLWNLFQNLVHASFTEHCTDRTACSHVAVSWINIFLSGPIICFKDSRVSSILYMYTASTTKN